MLKNSNLVPQKYENRYKCAILLVSGDNKRSPLTVRKESFCVMKGVLSEAQRSPLRSKDDSLTGLSNAAATNAGILM